MSLELDPIYHTETMVKILREQGCTQHAMELAELILSEHPEKQSVREILEELKEESKKAFERFVGARFTTPHAGTQIVEPNVGAPFTAPAEDVGASASGGRPQMVEEPATEQSTESDPELIRLAKLKELLGRVQRNRKTDEASQT